MTFSRRAFSMGSLSRGKGGDRTFAATGAEFCYAGQTGPSVVRPEFTVTAQRAGCEICAKVGDARSGGSLKVEETVAELNPLDDLGQAILAIEFAPFSLR